jgi:hypothetical protein
MKLTIIFLLLACTASAQTPLADVKLKTHQTNAGPVTTIDSVGKVWKNVKNVNPIHGMTYTYTLGDDSARYFHPVPGKTFKAKVIFYDAAIGLPAEPTTPVEIVTEVNSNDPLIKFSTGWSYQAVDRTKNPPIVWPDPFFNDDVHYTTTLNSWVEYTFTGKKIEVFSELQANHGKATVTITNASGQVSSNVVDMYKAATVNSRDLIFSKDLTAGTYTIRVTLSQVNLSVVPRQDSMVFDSFRVTK